MRHDSFFLVIQFDIAIPMMIINYVYNITNNSVNFVAVSWAVQFFPVYNNPCVKYS